MTKMKKTQSMRLLAGVLAVMVVGPALAQALDFNSAITVSGTGIGAKITVLTIQQSQGTTETGCVKWSGSADVIGASACPAGSPAFGGGNEKTGASQTLTRALSEAGVGSYAAIGIVLNVNQADAAVLDNMSMQLFPAASGTACATIPVGGGKGDGYSGAGTGGSGSFFTPNALAVTAMTSGCGPFAGSLRVGLAANMSNASGGGETWYLANTEPVLGVTTLCVLKTVSGGSSQSFDFSGTSPIGAFSLLAGEQQCTDVSSTPLTVTETVPSGWNTPSIGCNGGSPNVNGSGVTVTVPAETTVTCTFTNSLIVVPPPPVTNIPTLSEWMYLLLGMLLLASGWLYLRRR
jgi:hypothetical protein